MPVTCYLIPVTSSLLHIFIVVRRCQFVDCLQRLFGGALLGFLLVAAQPRRAHDLPDGHSDLEDLVMVRPELPDDTVPRDDSEAVLGGLLEAGLIVLVKDTGGPRLQEGMESLSDEVESARK